MLGKLLVTLGGLLVALLFVALLAPLFVDWTDFRTDFEDQASRIFGKKVTVHGAVEARILPFPSVTMNDVRVGQDVDGSPVVHVERFSMDAELAPFLSGEARIFDMRIEKPTARVRLLADGRLDWMRGATPSVPARNVVLEKVTISEGNIEFIDEQAGRTRKITGFDASMSAHSLAGPWRIEGRAAIDGEEGRFTLVTSETDARSGVIRLRTHLEPAAHPVAIDLEGELSAAGGHPVYTGGFSAVLTNGDDKKPAPRVRGAFELTNERVRVPEYRLEIGDPQEPYAVTGEATLDVGAKPEFLLTAEGQQIDVNRLAVNGNAAKTGRQPDTTLERRLQALISVASAIPVPPVEGRASLRLPAVLAGDTAFRDIQLDVRPDGNGWIVDRAVAVLPGRTQVEASGRLRLAGEPSFSGDLLVASTQPSGLANWLTGSVDPAVRNLRATGFSATVSLTPALQRFDRLEVVVGESRLTGRLEHQAGKEQTPTVSADLEGDLLDLGEAQALAALLGKGEAFADYRIAGRLALGRFTAFGVEAKNVEAIANRSDGVLEVERLAIGDVAGASFDMTGQPETGTATIAFRAEDAAPFLALLRDRLPQHPLLQRLARNADFYAGTDLRIETAKDARDAKLMNIRFNGTANGSRVGGEMKVEASGGLAALAGGGRMTLDATLENPSTAILFGQAGFDPLPFDADSGGLLALTVKSDGRKPPETALSFSTDRTKFRLEGSFALDADAFGKGRGRFTLESADAEPYLSMNAIAVPQTGLGLPVKLAGDLVVEDGQAVFDALEGTVAENPVSGRVAFARNAPVAKIEGNLRLGEIALPWLAEAMFGPVIDPMSGDLTKEAPGKPLAGDADISLAFSAVSFDPGLFGTIGDVSGRMAYKGGTLTLSDVSGEWQGGRFAGGRLSMANGEGAGIFQARLDLKDADLAGLVWKNGGGEPVARGRFDLTLAMESTGENLAAMRAALGGSGELRLAGLTVEPLNLDVAGPLITAVDLMEGDITAAKVSPVLETLLDNGRTVFGTVSVPFQIVDGELRAQNVAAETPHGHLSGHGRLVADGGVLNATLEIGLDPGDQAQAGAEPGVKLHFDGPLAAPERRLDVSDTVNFLSLRAYELERRRVERVQANVMEKQRLRREAALYRFREDERQAEKARAEEEARRKAEAARAKAEEEARAEAARRAEQEVEDAQGLPVPASEQVIREPLPPASGGTP